MLLRDVENMKRYYSQFAPELSHTKYGEEIWQRYEAGELSVNTVLTGEFVEPDNAVDVDNVMNEIMTARDEYQEKQQRLVEAEL